MGHIELRNNEYPPMPECKPPTKEKTLVTNKAMLVQILRNQRTLLCVSSCVASLPALLPAIEFRIVETDTLLKQ